MRTIPRCLEEKRHCPSGITASNKTYDGTTNATVNTGGAIYAGLVAGETLSTAASGSFDDENVGNGKTVTLTGTTNATGSTLLSNYNVTEQASTTANITPAAPTVTAPLGFQAYYGNTNTTGSATLGSLAADAADAAGAIGDNHWQTQTSQGQVLVTPIRNLTAQLQGQVLVQVSRLTLRSGAFKAVLPEQVSRVLRSLNIGTVARLADGRPLPEWLHFDPQTLTLTALLVPANALPLTLLVGSGSYRVEVEVTEIP